MIYLNYVVPFCIFGRSSLLGFPEEYCVHISIAMATSLDMSLDDRIKTRSNRDRARGRGRAPRGRGAGQNLGGGRMSGAVRRAPLGINSRPSAYAIAKAS